MRSVEKGTHLSKVGLKFFFWSFIIWIFIRYFIHIHGGFLKWWYPQNTPKWSFLVGKPMVVGYHHSRKPRLEKLQVGKLYCFSGSHQVTWSTLRLRPKAPEEEGPTVPTVKASLTRILHHPVWWDVYGTLCIINCFFLYVYITFYNILYFSTFSFIESYYRQNPFKYDQIWM